MPDVKMNTRGGERKNGRLKKNQLNLDVDMSSNEPSVEDYDSEEEV